MSDAARNPHEGQQLSPEQHAVVESKANSLTVVAAAGAGKTFVLVERYLRHVTEEGLRPDEILTITFTKKAAAEMKRRIVNRLRGLGRMDDAQIAETGPIQTIHSFCERLLRENALEAGLDPNFDILTESRSSRLVAECIREALASPLDEEPQAEALISFLAGKRIPFGDNKSPYAVLEGAVGQVLRELRGSGFTQLEVAQWHVDPRTLRERWEEWFVRELPDAAREALEKVSADTFHEQLQLAMKAAGKTVPAWMRGKPEVEAEDEALIQTCGLVQLACAAWWRLDREMEAMQSLDFTALEERAVRLVERSEATRARLRRQIRVVMVDESQDLNPIQYRLLQGMGAEREMLVGDAQQSIYGFRQADVDLFQKRAQQEGVLRLSRNYRSTPGILGFVDWVFGQQWSPNYQPMAPSPAVMDLDTITGPEFAGVEIWKQATGDTAAVAAYVRELVQEGVSPKEIALLVRDSNGALAAQRALELEAIPCRIAGGSERFYTRLEVRDLANALRAVADPNDDFSLLACLRSPMAGVSMDTVVMLGREPGVVERIKEFVPPVEEDAAKLRTFLAWFDPLRAHADRLAAWEVLSEVFAKSDYLATIARREGGEQILANARKLLSLATQEPDLGPLEYAERIREVQELRHKEGDAPADEEDADVVTIMTVHKSKGLEFPVVVLPQTDKRMTSIARDVVVEPRLGLVATKFTKGQCLMHKRLTAMKKERDEQEELRVLYVALTRAQQRLCVCLYPPRRDKTASKLLGEILGDDPPGIKVRDSQDLSQVPV